MKLRRPIAIIMVITLISSLFHFSASAEAYTYSGTTEDYVSDNITIKFHNEITEETRNKIIAHFSGKENPQSLETRGLTCTLLGHNLETGTTSTVTHKARTTAPRCLRETYTYEICSRCDYSEYTLAASQYIYCCS